MFREPTRHYDATMDFEVDPEHGFRIGELSPPELTREYLEWRRRYRDLVKRAVRVSRGSGGIWVEGNRLAYAAILFTRICVVATSVSALFPDCRPKQHWDFSSAASLVRNLAEAYFWYFWLCEDEVDPDVRQGRFILLYCHDHGSRGRLWPEPERQQSHAEVVADLTARFDANPYLATFSAKARREALRGVKTPFTQDEILERMGVSQHEFRVLYRFFSQHTHSGPISFFRAVDQDRGTGVETAQEKRYMIMAAALACGVLGAAINGHLKLFPDAEIRKPHLTSEQIVRNVERAQGREKRRAHK